MNGIFRLTVVVQVALMLVLLALSLAHALDVPAGAAARARGSGYVAWALGVVSVLLATRMLAGSHPHYEIWLLAAAGLASATIVLTGHLDALLYVAVFIGAVVLVSLGLWHVSNAVAPLVRRRLQGTRLERALLALRGAFSFLVGSALAGGALYLLLQVWHFVDDGYYQLAILAAPIAFVLLASGLWLARRGASAIFAAWRGGFPDPP